MSALDLKITLTEKQIQHILMEYLFNTGIKGPNKPTESFRDCALDYFTGHLKLGFEWAKTGIEVTLKDTDLQD